METESPRPIYVVASGPGAHELRSAFPGTAAVSIDELRPLEERVPGVVVVERGAVDAEAVLALAEEMEGATGRWTLVLARSDGNGGALEARPLSLGWPVTPEDLTSWAEGGDAVVFELRAVLARLARARHDINNPLTSAMAEAQLLLLDVPEQGEIREGLETIEAQLRRIRDMVGDLRALRRPD